MGLARTFCYKVGLVELELPSLILDFGLNHARSGFKPKKFYRQCSINVALYGIIGLTRSWRAAMPLHVSIVSVKNYK